jgi:uncharacterized membrane protein
MGRALKKYLIAGLLAWLPLAITVWVLSWLLGGMDSLFQWLLQGASAVLPAQSQPLLHQLREIPGLSIVFLVSAMLLTGVFVTNIFGQWWWRQWDALLHRIPIVKSIYSSVKQVSDTLFSTSGNAFREAVLVQYPRAGIWTIAFVTGKPSGEVGGHLQGDWLSIYVPTTPNPTSGFFLMLLRSDVVPLSMSVDQALKYVISMGVVAPPHNGTPIPTETRNQFG